MKIILVDDHPLFRSGMAAMLEHTFKGAQVIQTGDMSGLRQHLAAQKDIEFFVLDLIFPGFDVHKDFAKLRQALPLTPLVVVSMVNDDEIISEVMNAGANAFLSKSADAKDIAAALLSIMEGEIVVLKSSSELALPLPDNVILQNLTPRQIEVLSGLSRGLSNKEIGRELDISPFTVRIHVSALLRAIGVSSRSAAASFAASKGIR